MRSQASTPGRRGGRGRSTVLAAALVLPGLVAGCSAPGDEPVERVRSVVQTLLVACSQSEGQAVLDLLTEPTRKLVLEEDSVVDGCERVLDLGVDPSHELPAPGIFRASTVEAVEASGGFGSAHVSAPTGESSRLELENVGDRWLIANPAR
jgi:hypothetical protein